MKKCFIILSALTLLATTANAEYQVTQKDIDEATEIRAMGVNIGLDKASPDQILAVANAMAEGKMQLTNEQQQAIICVTAKNQDMQFKSPIEVYARYLSDKNFKEKTNAEYDKICGITKLVSEKSNVSPSTN